MIRAIEVPGEQVVVHADIGKGRVIKAILFVDDGGGDSDDPNNRPRDEWERLFNEMLALAPVNEYPADVSREAMYGPDPDETGEP